MIRFVVPLVLLSLAAPFAAATSPRVLAWDEAIAARKLALVSGETAIEITHMHPLKRTGAIRVKGQGPFMVRALDKPPGPDGKPVERPCVIPVGLDFPLLILMPDTTHPTGVRPEVVDDNPNGFRWGCYRFINATTRELLIRMENKVVRVPQGWKSVDIDLGGETRGVGALVALAENAEKPIYSAVWQYDKNARTLCFLVPGTDPRLSPLAFKAIPEDRRALELDSRPETGPPPPQDGKKAGGS